jgi:hypothetical protein
VKAVAFASHLRTCSEPATIDAMCEGRRNVIDVGRVDHDLVVPRVADRPECLDGRERQREEEDVGPNGILDLRSLELD